MESLLHLRLFHCLIPPFFTDDLSSGSSFILELLVPLYFLHHDCVSPPPLFLSSSQNECLPFCCSLFPEQHSPHLPSTPAPPKISFFPILMLLFSAPLNIADAFAPLLQVSFLKLQKSFGRLLTRQSRTLRSKKSALSTTKRTWSNKVCFRSLPRLRYVFFVPVSSRSSLHFTLPSSSHFDLRHFLFRCVLFETATPRGYQAWVAFSGA